MGKIQKRHEALCLKRIQNAQVKPGYCNMTFDSYLCWDVTEGGTVVRQPCPAYLNGINPAEFAVRECLPDGTWKPAPGPNSTDGWTNFTACLKPIEHDEYNKHHLARIQLMSEICYGISLVALIIAVLIMVLSKRLHCKSNSLHINLFMAFILRASVSLLKSVLFVDGIGLEKDIIRGSGGSISFKEGETDYLLQHWECKLLVTVFLYTVAASLMWIFMEGLYLHMLVYKTLFTERHGVRIYFFIGWISPLLYMIPWVLVRIYFDDDLCWNRYENDSYVWIFKGPLVGTVLVNFLFFIEFVCVLCKRVRSHRQPRGSSKHFRKVAKFALVLIPLFGVIYIAFAAYPHGINVHADMIYLYCEMFYNSIQGFILALLFCFLNEEVHNEIRRQWYRGHFSGPYTRSVFLSSWRQKSNVSRGVNMSTGGNLNETRVSNLDGDIRSSKSGEDRRPIAMVNWKSSHSSKDKSSSTNSND